MAGVRKKAHRGGKYQGWFINAAGKRKFFTGTRSRPETLRIAQRLEDDHRQVHLGYRPARSTADKHRHDPIDKVTQEYLAWGTAQGGRGGRAWSKGHTRNRRTRLHWWIAGLGLKTLADLDGVLPRVEEALRDFQAQGRTGKTLANYAEALTAFCAWCIRVGYLSDNPLKGLTRFDTTPQTRRRAMSADEIQRLLKACPPHQRLLLETAFMSGLRANELRNLSLDHIDLERGGLRLDAEWTKNRKGGLQPVPTDLLLRLQASAESGAPARLYEGAYAHKSTQANVPKDPLLYVPTHPAREFDKDLEAAGIPKVTSAGKLDFHACRLAYINLVIDSGATIKEAQELARHSTPQLTMNIYGRVREERLAQTVDKVADALRQDDDPTP
jgi:integrase